MENIHSGIDDADDDTRAGVTAEGFAGPAPYLVRRDIGNALVEVQLRLLAERQLQYPRMGGNALEIGQVHAPGSAPVSRVPYGLESQRFDLRQVAGVLQRYIDPSACRHRWMHASDRSPALFLYLEIIQVDR